MKKPEKVMRAQAKAKQNVAAFDRSNWIWLAAVLAAVFIIYVPTLQKEFINYDDNWYIYTNPFINEFTLENTGRIFSGFYYGQYSPVPTLFLSIIHTIAGDEPFLYNLSAVVLHLANVCLVCWLVFRLGKNFVAALAVAALFGVCPLNVESVAWASAAFKTGFYCGFFLLSLIAYTYYLSSDNRKYLAASLVLFVFSFLSKEQAAALPLSIVCIDFLSGRKILSKKVLLEKLPFFVLSAVFVFVTLTAVKSYNTELIYINHIFIQRVMYASYALGEYFIKHFIPYELSAHYPYPERGHLSFWFFIHPLFVAGLIYLFIRTVKKNKNIAFGILFFTANIFFTLALQFVSIRLSVIADRYVYVSSVGIFFLAVSVFDISQSKKFKMISLIALSVFFIFFSVTSYARCGIWKNSVTVWSDILNKYSETAFAYNNRGSVYFDDKKYDLAINDFNKAIEINPDYFASYNNRGNVYSEQGKSEKAIEEYSKAIELNPKFALAYKNRGLVFMKEKRNSEALKDFTKAIELNVDHEDAYINRGNLFRDEERNADAVNDYNKAIGINPFSAQAYFNRSILYMKERKHEEALKDFNKAIELKSNFAEAYVSRGNYFRDSNRNEEALRDYEKAIKINPALSTAYFNRGILYTNQQRIDEALGDLNKAIELKSDDANSYSNRGHILVLKKNYAAAIKDYDKVIELNPDYAEAYYSRGVIYMNEKRSDDALREYGKAIELNRAYVGAYYNSGILYFDKKKFDDAIKNYSKAIELKPDYAEAYFNRGLSEFYSQKKDAACKDLGKAASLGYKPAEDAFRQACR